jgi:hypothetical protein
VVEEVTDDYGADSPSENWWSGRPPQDPRYQTIDTQMQQMRQRRSLANPCSINVRPMSLRVAA